MPPKGRIVYSSEPTSTPAPAPKTPAKSAPPNQQTVYVERDRKGRKGKTVTVISGLQHDPATKEKMLKEFKSFCGAGGTVKEGNLEIQGDHRDKLIARLIELGYKAKQKGG